MLVLKINSFWKKIKKKEEDYASSKFAAGTPQTGHVKSSGNSSSSRTYPHTLQT